MASTEGESMSSHEVYSFFGYSGAGNCDRCDEDTMLNEYKVSDGEVAALCEKCEDRLGL
jgi:formylmethanofuran dehydrogenase subunit E